MAFHDHMQRNRFELKYVIDERRACGVRDFIRSHLVRDRFARADLAYAYPIYSVYLDNPALDLFGATVQGHANRFKLRARYYDERPDTPVFLEIKRHANDVVFKQRAAVKRSAIDRIFRPVAQPRRSDLIDPGDPEAWMALGRFCELRSAIGAEARAVVAYMREAWNAAANDDVRVTFDRRISGSWYEVGVPHAEALRTDRQWILPNLEGEMSQCGNVPRVSPWRSTALPGDERQLRPNQGAVVLELKFTGCFPRWMEDLVATFDLYRTSMAKYVRCVYALGPRRDRGRIERSASPLGREIIA